MATLNDSALQIQDDDSWQPPVKSEDQGDHDGQQPVKSEDQDDHNGQLPVKSEGQDDHNGQLLVKSEDQDDHNGNPLVVSEKQPRSDDNHATGEYREEIFDIASSAAAQQWKKALSGALDESRLFCGLIVLGIFYIVYINVNAYHKGDTKDEGDIIHNCTCKPSHQKFYIVWSAICWAIWLICHCVLAIPEFKKYFCIKTMQKEKINDRLPCWSIPLLRCCSKSENSDQVPESENCSSSDRNQPPGDEGNTKYIVEQNITQDKDKKQKSYESLDEIACCCCSLGCMQIERHKETEDKTYCCRLQCSFSTCCCCYHHCFEKWCLGKLENTKEDIKGCCSCFKNCCPKISHSFTKLKQTMFEHTNNQRYEYYLWTKYYELYIVGTAKEDEKITVKSIDDYIKNSSVRDATDGDSNKEKKSREEKYINALSDSIQSVFHYICQVFIHLFLFIIQFFAQSAVIPLFTLQIFDTYAFLCFAADNSCTRSDEYTLHFHQTVITFSFYCSLMASFLASTMLRWIPWPFLKPTTSKLDLEKGAVNKSETIVHLSTKNSAEMW